MSRIVSCDTGPGRAGHPLLRDAIAISSDWWVQMPPGIADPAYVKIPFFTMSERSLMAWSESLPKGSGTLKRISMEK